MHLSFLHVGKLVKTHSLSTRVVGTSFDNRQDIFGLIAKYNPAQVSVKLVRNRSNAFDVNAVAVTVAVKDKVRAVIGYLPKAGRPQILRSTFPQAQTISCLAFGHTNRSHGQGY